MDRSPLPEPRRILVVEDDRPGREALTALLEDEGYEVVAAAAGFEALAAVSVSPVALALVDYQLPDVDGLTLVRALRERGCACVLVTGSADLVVDDSGDVKFQDRTEAVVAAGALGCLGKPIDPAALLALVGDLLR